MDIIGNCNSLEISKPGATIQGGTNPASAGWGTFNNKSVLSHVLLPEGFAMNLGVKLHQNNADNYLKEAIYLMQGRKAGSDNPGL